LKGYDGEENCTCSSDEANEMDEEMEDIPITSAMRLATTEYGGREVVETEETNFNEYRGVHKNIF
jgi:hypothetical protein